MPTKVHITDKAKQIAEAYVAFVKSKGYEMTQTACIEKLLEAGYEHLTGKRFSKKK